jgi:hypothetical protein
MSMRIKCITLAMLVVVVMVGLPVMSAADPADTVEATRSPVHMVLEPGASQTLPAADEGTGRGPQTPGALAAGWETVKTEDFEGAFPNEWDVRGDPTWDREWDDDPSFAYDLAQWTGWCAGGGPSARTPGALPGGAYAPNMNAWMIYGPFSLKGSDDARVDFWYWLWSEAGYDKLSWLASKDGTNFYGYGNWGNVKTWNFVSFDLKAVPTLGNLAGKSQVWVAFAFTSDSGAEFKGAYIDDIEIERYRTNSPVNVSVDPSSGNSRWGVWESFTTTWSDADGYQDLKQTYFHIGATPSLADSVTMLYNAKTNRVWLRNDSGTAWLGGYAPGTFIDIENSRAIVRPASMSTAGGGDELSVTWFIQFKPTFLGAKKLGMKALDAWGAKAPGQWKGTWLIH